MIDKKIRDSVFNKFSKLFSINIAKDIELSIYNFSIEYAENKNTPFLLEITANQFMPTKSVACFLYYPDALKYGLPPAPQNPIPVGWENAEKIKVIW